MLPSARALLAFAVCATAAAFSGCRRTPAEGVASSSTPTLRLYVVSTVAGALEPCGCTKDMLGGVDHLAALVASQAKEAPHALVVAAGPMLFLNPKLEETKKAQDIWKAEALATSFAELRLSAWAPGANDWAAGVGELDRLTKMTQASLLAGNLHGAPVGARATGVVVVNGTRVGLAGVSDPTGPFGVPDGVAVGDLKTALEKSHAALEAQKSDLEVALVAADRGRAMRLAEQVPGFAAFVVGKPYDQGDGNDAPTPPILVGQTLVISAPNHLQAVAVVDLFVRGDFRFRDGTGIDEMARRQSLDARISELEKRIREWEAHGVSEADLKARRADLDKLVAERKALKPSTPPSEGSFFRYRLEEIRERLGSEPGVAHRMDDYYKRVNEHNREAFKDRLPPVPKPGEAKYIGAEACSNCHDKAYAFWLKTPHAGAYATLSKQHKEFNLDCVSCHVTGYEKPGGSTVTHTTSLESVQCEVCHGPGSRHEDDPSDTSALVRSPPKTLCAPACHHPPHVQDGWNVDEAWKVIVGKGHGAK
jgi:Cytochrome c554 and c-prime